MPNKQQASALGLSSLNPNPDAGSEGSLVSFGFGHSLSRDQQRTLAEWQTQALVVDGTAQKGILGLSKIAELHRHGSVTFDDTVGFILQVKNGPHTREHQAIIDEFATHQIQLFAKHTLGAIEVAANGIGTEIDRSLYPPPEPRSLWQRVFG